MKCRFLGRLRQATVLADVAGALAHQSCQTRRDVLAHEARRFAANSARNRSSDNMSTNSVRAAASRRTPFTGAKYQTAFEKMMGHARDMAPPIRSIRADVPEELAAVIERMMAKDRKRRFATPREVTAALRPFLAEADLGRLCAKVADGTECLADTSNEQNRAGTDADVTWAVAGSAAQARARQQPPRRSTPWWRTVAAVGLLLALAGGGLWIGINYRHLWDVNALCEFQSPRFSLSPSSNSTKKVDQPR